MTIEPLTRERRRQQTRSYLLAAAAEVFGRLGFHDASLDEVAAAAGYTKGAVYSNFRSKEELFLALLEARYQESMKSVESTLEHSDVPPEARLGDFVKLLSEQMSRGPANWPTLHQEFLVYAMRNPAAREKLVELDDREAQAVASVIEAERTRQGIRSVEPAELVARIVLALDRGIAVMQALEPELVNERFLKAVMSFIADGLTGGSQP